MIVKRKERDKAKKGNSRVIEDKLSLSEKFNLIKRCDHQNQFGTVSNYFKLFLYDAYLRWKNVEGDSPVTTADPITCSPLYLT